MRTTEETNQLNTLMQKLFPVAAVTRSTLGGEANASIHIVASLDKRDTWANNILQNSRFVMFSWDADNTLKSFCQGQGTNYTRLPTFRQCKARDVRDVQAKIEAWIGKAIDT